MSVYKVKLAWILLFICCTSWANSIKISPVRLEFSGKTPMAILTVTNPGDKPLMLQCELMRWTQIDGKDHYQPSQDILIVPPIFSIPPYQRQVMRLALSHAQVETELAYRLFLREIIPADQSGNIRGLRMALQVSMPVFVLPKVPTEQFYWQLKNNGTKQIASLHNKGNVTLFINQLELLDGNGKSMSDQQKIFKYILPAQKSEWTLVSNNKTPETQYRIKASINGNEVTHEPKISS